MASHYMDEMLKFIATLIQQRLAYATILHTAKGVRKIERIQRVAREVLPSLKDLSYEERLEMMWLSALEKGGERGMVAVF